MSRKQTIWTLLGIVAVIGIIMLVTGFKVGTPLVSVRAEEVFTIGPYIVTNSLLVTWIVMILLVVLSIIATKRLRSGDPEALKHPRGLQNAMEMVVEAFYNTMAGVSPKFVGRFFVIVATIFLLVLPSNWFGLLPGVGSIGICFSPKELNEIKGGGHSSVAQPEWVASANGNISPIEPVRNAEGGTEGLSNSCAKNGAEAIKAGTSAEEARTIFHPLFRAGSADLNLTLALAIVSFLVTEFWGFRSLGFGYLKKFFNFKGGAIGFMVGIIELISEFARLISFTFRLFGNIFAGEVVLLVMAFLFPTLLSLPFYGLELFVGLVQAFVFAMLTMAFINMAAESHDHDDHGAEHAH